MPQFLRKRGTRYHYRRRVPKDFQFLFPKDYIQIALQTDSETIALHRASVLNVMVEEFLTTLIGLSAEEVQSRFSRMVQMAKLSGFRLRPRHDIAQGDELHQLVNRLNASDKTSLKTIQDHILGETVSVGPYLKDALGDFLEFEKDKLKGKSDDQIRKWENPRKKAINNFKKVVGNKALSDITRQDIMDFRSWWMNRIREHDLSSNSANKDFTYLKAVLDLAVDNYDHIQLPVHALFRNIRLKNDEKSQRLPFENEFIQETLLNPNVIKLNKEARMLIFAMSDTGARISELTGLEENDIILEGDIPHIKIRPNETRSLKTKQSKRDIPLVGAALCAFQALGGPFKLYHGKSDLVSNTINKYFRENNILPSSDHSLYSLRHSFEDRLTAVEPPDKLQAALMGHKYNRPRYGKGPSLAQKLTWLEKIAFKIGDDG